MWLWLPVGARGGREDHGDDRRPCKRCNVEGRKGQIRHKRNCSDRFVIYTRQSHWQNEEGTYVGQAVLS